MDSMTTNLLLRRQSSDVEPIPAEYAVLLMSQYRISIYTNMALAVALFYSIITTLDRESKCIWTTPRQVSSIIFFINRYMGLLSALFPIWELTYHATLELCNAALWGQHVSAYLTSISVNYILMLRVLALYSQNKKLSIVLHGLFGVNVSLILFDFVFSTIKEQVAIGGIDGYVFCGTDSDVSPAIQMISWTSNLVFEFILLCAALYQSAIIYKESGWKFKGMELVTVLLKDQVIFFFAVMIPAITNIINFWLLPAEEAVSIVIGILASAIIPCIIGSMLMFHLKEAAQRGVNGGTMISTNARLESTMLFS